MYALLILFLLPSCYLISWTLDCTPTTMCKLFHSFISIAIPTPAQQKDELPCHGTAPLQHPVLQAIFPILRLQCAWWAWQWRWVLIIFLPSFITCLCVVWALLSMFCTCTGKGCVFTYDAVGSYERTGYSAQGTGSTLIMPVLDNQLKSPSPLLLPARVSHAWFYIYWSLQE